jgi:hypothetical protein
MKKHKMIFPVISRAARCSIKGGFAPACDCFIYCVLQNGKEVMLTGTTFDDPYVVCGEFGASYTGYSDCC